LRELAGEQGYRGGFIEHYVLPLIYPQALTRETQVAIGIAVLAVNAVFYALWLRRRRRR